MTENPGNSLVQTIVKSDLATVIYDAGEISIDSLLDDGLFKDIPIFNTIISIGKTFGNIRDFIFAKKMMLFLQSVSSLSTEERKKLIEKLEADNKYSGSVGETIVELLEKVDGLKKPILVANALKLYAKEEITFNQLQRVNNAIDRFLLCDIDELRKFCINPSESFTTSDDPILANFINAGLGYVMSGFGGGGVHPTETAPLFVKIADDAKI
jgi:hypothetical protein